MKWLMSSGVDIVLWGFFSVLKVLNLFIAFCAVKNKVRTGDLSPLPWAQHVGPLEESHRGRTSPSSVSANLVPAGGWA